MRKHSHKSSGKNLKGVHPGSSVEDARQVGGKADSGAPERDVTARN
jgi:hypothetical protein